MEGYRRLSSLDFSKDKGKLALSYLVRFMGVGVFGMLFALFARVVHPRLPE